MERGRGERDTGGKRGESAGKGVGDGRSGDGGAGWEEEGAEGSGGEMKGERDAESSCVVGEWCGRGGFSPARASSARGDGDAKRSANAPLPGSSLLPASCRQERCCAELQADSKAFWLARCSEAGVVFSTQILLPSALPLEHLQRGADGQIGGCLSQLSPSPGSLQNLMSFTPSLGKKKN